MNYTPEEVAKLLANRPNQPHYIAALIAECVATARADERERCLYWCSLADHEGYATHHIREGTPARALPPSL